jgi:hypothetical protein
MSDIADAVTDAVEKANESRLNTVVAAAVAISATFMALCNVKDGNVVQAMAQAQANAVDTWAYYQAKGTKQNLAESMIDTLTLQRDLAPNMTPEARGLLDKTLADYTERAKKYESEKAEIKKNAEGYAKEYDRLNLHDDQFDMAEASLSVAIAMFGVTALTQKRWLLVFAGCIAAFGIVLGVAGFAGLNVHPDFLAKLLG